MRPVLALLAVSLLPLLAIAELPSIVPRRTWDPGYRPPKGVTRYRGPLAKTLEWIVVHHSDFLDAPGPAGILAYHRQVSGFADVGYHFVIGIDGTIYEGRDVRLMGAHAGRTQEATRGAVKARKHGGDVHAARRKDPDYGAIGIVLDGYWMNAPPLDVQLASLDRLVTFLRAKYGIAADHVITHREVKTRLVEAAGLTFVGPDTVCPGDGLQAALEGRRSSDLSSLGP